MNSKCMYTYSIKKQEEYDPLFVNFMDKVEQIVYGILQVYLLDLPDEDYYAYFEEELIPEQVADIVVKGNMFF